MKAINFRRLLRFTLLLFYLSPFFFFFLKFKISGQFNTDEVMWALRNSVFQSTVAAVIALALALPMAMGLYCLQGSKRTFLHRFLILPQVLPVIFSILIGFSLLNPFPKGNVGIIFLFVLVNVGLAAVLVFESVRSRVGKSAVVAEVFGLKRSAFYLKVFAPLMFPDLIRIFFLVFVFCFSSFSIPIVAGDGRGINLEILVFEKIFIESNWSQAFNISLLQTLLVFAGGYLLMSDRDRSAESPSEGTYLRSKVGLVLAGIFCLIYLSGYAKGLLHSLPQLKSLLLFKSELQSAMSYSLFSLSIFMLTGLAFLLLWLLDYIENGSFNPALHLVSFSTIVVGFSFYLVFPLSREVDIFKLVLALSILIFPTLFKLFLQSPVEGLRRQIEVARIFGIPRHTIAIDVVARQLSAPVAVWATVWCLWFASDYAVSRAVGLQTTTLGTLTESFLNSYRLGGAYWMSLIIIAFVFVFLWVGRFVLKGLYVVYKKSGV